MEWLPVAFLAVAAFVLLTDATDWPRWLRREPLAARRLRAVTVGPGLVNQCPKCDAVVVMGWFFDFALDPAPEEGTILVGSPATLRVLRELGTSTEGLCIECDRAPVLAAEELDGMVEWVG